jgi:23S rRNA A1618 N6-methylase RlmF
MNDERANFEFFSNEYAQALQAFTAIENQASTIAAFGATDELRGFVDRFIEMASRTKALAEEREETHFVEWFTELIRKAENLRSEFVQK